MNHILTPFAEVYGLGTMLRQQAFRRGWLKSRRLSRPVISVGNLTVGGSGKTPLVGWIAETLLYRGYKPAILTRGYGRKRGPDILILEPQPERNIDARTVGDEPALLARALPRVPIVISANRHRAGQLAEERFGVDIHILDDGFQHFALERDVNIVTIDVTQELEDGALLPAGRLREPCSALRRADLILLTRVEIRSPDPIEKQVRSINARAQVFHCSTALRGLIDAGNGILQSPAEYRNRPVCAFCGIGNPRAFFSDLRRWGFTLGAEIAFRDHHVYGPGDMKRLLSIAQSAGAVAFLTTEKDVMNLSPQWKPELPVLACGIRPEISGAKVFEEAILARVSPIGLREKAASGV
ncbi:MAG: tetraacyldisaccharide 4'-kinase [Acidobacteria bacterium]|nr:tetraacyldisaccharide 4'-kinase [Acidobacteriota bacterium]